VLAEPESLGVNANALQEHFHACDKIRQRLVVNNPCRHGVPEGEVGHNTPVADLVIGGEEPGLAVGDVAEARVLLHIRLHEVLNLGHRELPDAQQPLDRTTKHMAHFRTRR
jgi:hypothetical protein